MSKQANLYGLDLPERSKYKIDYGNNPIGIVKNVILNWHKKWKSDEFDDVLIVGIDDDGIEQTFNFSTVISIVEIDLGKDENDRYNPHEVQQSLIRKLEEVNGEKRS